MFEIWKLKRARKRVYDDYEPKIRELKKTNPSKEQIDELESSVHAGARKSLLIAF